MIDFQLYNGDALPPLSGHVGFYVGSAPSPQHPANSTIVRGRLGKYPVKWHRWSEEGEIKQQALIYMRWFQEVDIWMSAPQQSDLDNLVAILSQLPLFNKKPTSPLVEDSVIEELLDTHSSLYFSVMFGGPMLSLLGFWLLKRRLRRVDSKLSHRLSWLTAYWFALFLLMAAAVSLFGYLPLSNTVIARNAVWFTLLYGAVLSLVFCLTLPIIAVIARCRGR